MHTAAVDATPVRPAAAAAARDDSLPFLRPVPLDNLQLLTGRSKAAASAAAAAAVASPSGLLESLDYYPLARRWIYNDNFAAAAAASGVSAAAFLSHLFLRRTGGCCRCSASLTA